ncbi:MAG: hypothetical protein H0U10_11055 [Chloroflexia bacterium]|nr:hypothetical protein [Chloroflexia bacterium]
MPRGLALKTRTLIDTSAAILAAIQPATVRGVAYKLFTRKLIPDMSKGSTDKVSRVLTIAREQGTIPWGSIVDETRAVERRAAWGDLAAFGETVRDAYHKDRWDDQPERLFVVSEKNTVGGLLRPVLRRYGVPFQVLHGFGSATALNDLAGMSASDPRPLTIFYVGDHDPSGRHMSDVDIPGRIDRYGGEASIVRLAVTPAQIAAHRLSTFSAHDKRLDSRYGWFLATHGETCAELDALDPNAVRSLVEGAIVAKIDAAAWRRSDAAESAELATLADVFAAWPGAA